MDLWCFLKPIPSKPKEELVTDEDLKKEVLDISKPLYLNVRAARRRDTEAWVGSLGTGSCVSTDNATLVRIEGKRRDHQIVHITLWNKKTLAVPRRLLTNYHYEDLGKYPEGYRC